MMTRRRLSLMSTYILVGMIGARAKIVTHKYRKAFKDRGKQMEVISTYIRSLRTYIIQTHCKKPSVCKSFGFVMKLPLCKTSYIPRMACCIKH